MGLLPTVQDLFSPEKLDTRGAYGSALLIGAAAHQLFFRFGEWDLYAAQLIFAFIFANVGGTAALVHENPNLGTLAAFRLVSTLITTVVAGIFSSMLIYRGFFHRLNRFPGPFLARLSNFYVTSLSISKFRLFEEVQQLHKQYGDIVRIGMTFYLHRPKEKTMFLTE